MRKFVGVHNEYTYMRVHEKYACGTETQLERSIGGRTQSIIGRGYKELELSQVIPADRPYVGLLVIKIFPAYLLPGRSEALTKTTSEDA